MGFNRICMAAVLVTGVSISQALAPAHASPRSSALIDEGIVELQAGKWRQALARFLAASVADREDAEALFFQGVALNRLGLHKAALGQLDQAVGAGVKNPDMDFELGWARLGTGQYDTALASLAAYKAANPDSAKTSELIGRAELARGNADAANAAFDEALRLDPGLEPSVDFFRSALASAEGDTIESEERLASVTQYNRSGPLSETMRRQQNLLRSVEGTRAAAPIKPWTVFGATAVGRNSNVIALSEDIARPADISRKDSTYYDLTAGGTYRHMLDPTQSLSAGTVLNHRNYRDIDGNDTVTINLFARYDKRISRRFAAAVTGTVGRVYVDEDKRQTSASISPSLQYRINDRLNLSAFYTARKLDYPDPNSQPAARDPDSKQQTAGADLAFSFPDWQSQFIVGVARINNSAVGSDNDYNALRFSGTVRSQLPYDVTAGFSFVRTSYDYENNHSLAPTNPPGVTAFGFKRQDSINSFSFDLTRPINETFTAFARATKTRANSNLAVFAYEQNDFQFGVTARF